MKYYYYYYYYYNAKSETDLAASVVVVENTESNCWQNAGEIQEERSRYRLV